MTKRSSSSSSRIFWWRMLGLGLALTALMVRPRISKLQESFVRSSRSVDAKNAIESGSNNSIDDELGAGNNNNHGGGDDDDELGAVANSKPGTVPSSKGSAKPSIPTSMQSSGGDPVAHSLSDNNNNINEDQWEARDALFKAFEEVMDGSAAMLPQFREVRTKLSSSPSNSSSKPLLILHLGPHKTASSTIQCQLLYFRSFLQDHGNITYVGRHYEECQSLHQKASKQHPFHHVDTRSLVRCLDGHTHDSLTCHKTSAWKAFETTLTSLRKQNTNIILSDEAFSRVNINDHNLALLYETIHLTGFHLRLVMVYRHYFSWFTSQYNEHYKPLSNRKQYQKWPATTPTTTSSSSGGSGGGKGGGDGGSEIRPFVEYFHRQEEQRQRNGTSTDYPLAADRNCLHPVNYLQEVWTDPKVLLAPSHQEDVVIINLHDSEGGGGDKDIVVDFIKLAYSPDVGQKLAQYKKNVKKTIPTKSNPSLNLNFDMLTVQARQRGYLQNHPQLTRRKVAFYVEKVLPKKLNMAKVPWLCLDDTELDFLEKRSLGLGQRVSFAPHYDDNADNDYEQQQLLLRQEHLKAHHHKAFTEFTRKHQHCNWNIAKMLESKQVQSFFRSIKAPSS